MSEIPAGWYDDGSGSLRYYDGAAWTEHVAGYAPQPAPAQAARKGMPLWGWVLLGAGVLVVVLGLVATGVGVYYAQHAPLDAATAAITTYDKAWREVDCGALAQATTMALREDWGYDDCSVFVADAKDFDEASRDYKTVFVSKGYAHGQVSVVTTESYTDDGGTALVDHVTYTIIKDGDAWRIDSIDFGDGGGTAADNHTNV